MNRLNGGRPVHSNDLKEWTSPSDRPSGLVVCEAKKRIRGIDVLNGISLACFPGQVVGLCGANGSGKTMLMRAMVGLMYLDNGYVEFDGKRLGRDIDFIPRCGVLIENPAFLGRYSAFDNLRFIAGLSMRVDVDDIRRCIRFVGLDPDDRRRYRQFSLGMKQRLGIAAAIMGNPQVVVLDEPTNALDESGFGIIDAVADDIRQRGAIGIVASHDADVLKRIADVVYRLDGGSVIAVEDRASNAE
ncbi:ATP-binding cassette domain-containing protein [Collinsella ihumii]|uniref:ATP-binding cassette domain-containing protein n=1 Tax=Collinsella ihumii TaxID=1720204 RepID=UPI0025AAC496|nr:ABC transporter ATP-binding protein [Collinsella ihumii]MDN0055788.1 ABC transporter ATP-binding protein [Collinsella ihumii]